MTNLKKSLALVVALVMLLGMMTVAAAFSDVPSDYDFTDEVSMLSDLQILSGYPDGTFKPEATITRAEACAVIYRMLSGKNLAANFAGATAFSDVAADNWASGYVNYCTELGIVQGYPDGTFQPTKPVSFAEFCTMLVRALGLDTGKLSYPFGYLAVADMNKVTDSVDLLPNDAAPRGIVAKLAYNAIMNATYARIATEDNKNPTIAADVLKLKSYTAVIEGINGYGEGETDDGEIKLVDCAKKFEFSKDSSLLGSKVKVWYKGEANSDDVPTKFDKVYAVVPTGNSSLTLNLADLTFKDDTDKLTYGDPAKELKYHADALPTFYINMEEVASFGEVADLFSESATVADKYTTGNILAKATFVDNDDDGKYEVVFITEYSWAKVSRVTSDKIYFADGAPAIDLVDADDEDYDVSYPDGLKKDDIVFIYFEASTNKAVLTLVPKSVGTLTGLTSSKYTIGGTDYKITKTGVTIDNSNLGKSIDFYVAPDFGYIFKASNTSSTANVMYIKAAQATPSEWEGEGPTYQAKVVLSDGTSKTFDFVDADAYDGEDEAGLEGWKDAGVYTYSLNSKGELTKVTQQISYASGVVTTDGEGVGFPEKNGSLLKLIDYSEDAEDPVTTNYALNSDSVFFFIDSDGKVKAYQGTLPSFSAVDYTADDYLDENDAFGVVSLKTGTAFRTVKYGIVDIGEEGRLTGASETTDIIGYCTAVKFVTDGDNYAKKYTIAAKGSVSDYLTEAETTTSSLDPYFGSAGGFVKFDLTGDGRISAIDESTVHMLDDCTYDVRVAYLMGVSGDVYDFRSDDGDYTSLSNAKPWYLKLDDGVDIYTGNFKDNKSVAADGSADDIATSFIYSDDDNILYPVYLVLNDDKDTILAAFVSTNEGADTFYFGRA